MLRLALLAASLLTSVKADLKDAIDESPSVKAIRDTHERWTRHCAVHRTEYHLVIGVCILPGGTRTHFTNGEILKESQLMHIHDPVMYEHLDALRLICTNVKSQVESLCSFVSNYPCFLYENAFGGAIARSVNRVQNTSTRVIDFASDNITQELEVTLSNLCFVAKSSANILMNIYDRVGTILSPVSSTQWKATLGTYCGGTMLSQYVNRSEVIGIQDMPFTTGFASAAGLVWAVYPTLCKTTDKMGLMCIRGVLGIVDDISNLYDNAIYSYPADVFLQVKSLMVNKMCDQMMSSYHLGDKASTVQFGQNDTINENEEVIFDDCDEWVEAPTEEEYYDILLLNDEFFDA